MKKNIFLLLSLCLVMFSCDEETVPSITLNQTEFAVSDAGGSQSISFESNMSWTAKSSANWCTVSPASGDASIKGATVTLSANDTYDARSCNVTIVVEGLSKTFTINQSTNLGLIVSPDKYDLGNDATTIDVEVKANVEFDVSISDDWITKVTTRGLTTTKLQFDIAKNKSYGKREGSITIKQKNGQLTSTIKVFQSQEDAIILSNKTENVSKESQTLEVELKTNVNFEVIIPEAAKSWVSYTGTRALRTETLLLKITANEDYNTRTTEIYVKNKATNLKDTLTINQSANLGLIITQDKYNLGNDATTIEVEVKSNIEFDVTISDNWITKVTTRGLTSTKLQFNIAKNKSYDNRSGTITIKQKNGTLTKTIMVYQSQEDAIILSNKTENLSNESQALEVELKTNVDFEVIIPEGAKSWVSYTPTRALRTETLLLNIAANEGYDVRTTKIYVKNKATNLQDTLTINQNANLGFTVSTDKFNLNNDATTIEVDVASNFEFDVTISDDWITKVTTRGLTSTKLQFNIAKNKSYDNRGGSITIKQKGGTLTSIINVYQSQEDAIILSNKTENLSNESQALEVELKTNVDFEVIIPEGAKSWVSYTPTRALRTETLLLNIAANEGYDVRTTKIYVKNKATNLQDTLTINQNANLGFTVSTDKFNLNNDATTIEVDVASNFEFDVTISDDWITKVTTRGLTSTKLQFNIAKNKSYDNRSGTITIKQKNGTLTKTIMVYQSQEDAIILSNKTENLSNESQALEVELKTNVDFEVIIPEGAKSWVSYTPTRALRTETLLLNIAANEGFDVRTTKIYVKNKATNLQDTLTISQYGSEPFVYMVKKMGTLSTILNKTQKDTITTMIVRGEINMYDFEVMKLQMPKLRSIDLKDVKCYGDKIPDEAFGREFNFGFKVDYTKIILPLSITAIGNYAFADFSDLTGTLTLPAGLLTIGDHAFRGCKGFTGPLNLPAKMTSIGVNAFADCTGFTGTLTLPAGLKAIGQGAFNNCTGFNGSLKLPDGLTTLESMTFAGCTGFTGSLTFPNGITTIDSYSFENCSGFTGVTLPVKLNKIGSFAFSNCTGITGILTLPDELTNIGERAFFNCSKITGDVVFPLSLIEIGAEGFFGCDKIAAFQFPHTTIFPYAFGMFPVGSTVKVRSSLIATYTTAIFWFGNNFNWIPI